MTDSLRILHINSYMLAGRFYRHMYQEQATRGHELEVYVPAHKSVDAERAELGYPATVSPVFTRGQRLSYYAKQKSILRDADARFVGREFDVIHAHSLFANGNVALALNKKASVPYVVAVRGTDVNVFFRKMPHLRRRGVSIMEGASRIVFISHPAREFVLSKYVPQRMRAAFAEKSVVIPNGIEDFWLQNQPIVRADSPHGRLRLLQVGDIWAIKNPLASAKAAQILAEAQRSVSIEYVGRVRDPGLAKKLEKYPNSVLLPFMDKVALKAKYANAHIMVLPSVQETFGLVYAEAMSQGLPVIYTRGQGFDGQFGQGEVGYAVDPKSPDDIAKAVVSILENYSEISHRCLAAATRYSWSRIVDMYDEIYDGMRAS